LGVWDSYQSRLSVRGATKREVRLNREHDYLHRKVPASLSYQKAIINGAEQEVAIINSDNLEQKTICSMPGDIILCGSLVEWMGNRWLVSETDANNEVYTKGIMLQCNHLLKWIADDGSVVERWSIVSDGTKYLTGETVSMYNENGMSLGDTRISVSLARDEYTVKLGRDVRFLIDDEATDSVLAYRLTKPFKIGGVFNGHGVMSFVLTEVNTEDDDNLELRIADYYKHFPRTNAAAPSTTPVTPGDVNEDGKRVWL